MSASAPSDPRHLMLSVRLFHVISESLRTLTPWSSEVKSIITSRGFLYLSSLILEETSAFDKPLAQFRQLKVQNQMFGFLTRSLGQNCIFQKSGAPVSCHNRGVTYIPLLVLYMNISKSSFLPRIQVLEWELSTGCLHVAGHETLTERHLSTEWGSLWRFLCHMCQARRRSCCPCSALINSLFSQEKWKMPYSVKEHLQLWYPPCCAIWLI